MPRRATGVALVDARSRLLSGKPAKEGFWRAFCCPRWTRETSGQEPGYEKTGSRDCFRHDAARRGAMPRREHGPAREAAGGAAAGEAERGHHRGGLPGGVAGRLRGGEESRHGNQEVPHRGAGALREGRHREVRRGAEAGGRPRADPRVPRDERDPPRIQAEEGEGRDRPPGGRRRGLCQKVLQGRAVQPRGRLAHRAGVPGRSGPRGDRRGRHDGEHPRHGRLHRAAGVPQAADLPARARPGAEGRGGARALPQRPGPGGRQLAGGGRMRRARRGMHHQRHRRARGQLRAGRAGDGAEGPQSSRACAPRSCSRRAAW